MGVAGSTQRLRPLVNPDGSIGIKVREPACLGTPSLDRLPHPNPTSDGPILIRSPPTARFLPTADQQEADSEAGRHRGRRRRRAIREVRPVHPLRFLPVAFITSSRLSVPSSFAVDRRRRSCPGDPNARFPTPRPPSTPRSSRRHRNPTPGSTTRSPSRPTSASCYSRTKRTSSIACESTRRSCTPTRTQCGPGRRRAPRNVRRAGCATRRTGATRCGAGTRWRRTTRAPGRRSVGS